MAATRVSSAARSRPPTRSSSRGGGGGGGGEAATPRGQVAAPVMAATIQDWAARKRPASRPFKVERAAKSTMAAAVAEAGGLAGWAAPRTRLGRGRRRRGAPAKSRRGEGQRPCRWRGPYARQRTADSARGTAGNPSAPEQGDRSVSRSRPEHGESTSHLRFQRRERISLPHHRRLPRHRSCRRQSPLTLTTSGLVEA